MSQPRIGALSGSAPASESNLTLNRMLVTVCAMLATLMQALDSTIANVALPYMQGSLSATSDQITWVLTSYIVAAAIMTAPVGWLSARFGRKAVFVVSLVGFTVASMLCGVAQSLTQMVVFRLLQGVFGAALVPLSQATMLDLYPAEQRGQAMAVWGMGVMLGPILGPTLGGWLTDAYDWRWVFFVNLPFGVVATLGLMFLLSDSRKDTTLKFDWIGFAALSLGIGALQMMLDRGEQKDWFSSTEILTETVLAGLGFYLFVVHMLTARKPFITPAIFRDRNLVSGLVVMFAVGSVLLATSALLAPYLQRLGGYPVATAGLLMAPRGFGTMLAMLVAGRLISRVDPRIIMFVGLMAIAWSLNAMTGWTPAVTRFELITNSLVQGAGLGLVFTPLSVLTFATLAPEMRAEGTALFSLSRNIGSAIGISVTSFLLSQNTQIMHAELASFITPFNHMIQSGGAYQYWNTVTPSTLAVLNGEITRQASVIAYVDDFKFMMLVTLPTALLLLLMRRPKEAGAAQEEAAVID